MNKNDRKWIHFIVVIIVAALLYRCNVQLGVHAAGGTAGSLPYTVYLPIASKSPKLPAVCAEMIDLGILSPNIAPLAVRGEYGEIPGDLWGEYNNTSDGRVSLDACGRVTSADGVIAHLRAPTAVPLDVDLSAWDEHGNAYALAAVPSGKAYDLVLSGVGDAAIDLVIRPDY